MKLQLLQKLQSGQKSAISRSLMVIAMFFASISGAWADVRVMPAYVGQLGLSDNSTPAWTYQSKYISLAADETVEYTFTNYMNTSSSDPHEYWGWIFEGTDGTNFFDVRMDAGWWVAPSGTSAYSITYSGDAFNNKYTSISDYLTDMNGATVTLTVSHDRYYIYVKQSVTTASKQTYSGTFTVTGIVPSSSIKLRLVDEGAHQVISKLVKTSSSGFLSTYENYTSYITNPDFENDTDSPTTPTGWTVTGDDASSASGSDKTGVVETSDWISGKYLYYSGWNHKTLSQTLSNLPAGRYTLYAQAGSWGDNRCWLTVNNVRSTEFAVGDNTGIVDLSQDFYTSEQSDVTIGSGANWGRRIDNFTLVRTGDCLYERGLSTAWCNDDEGDWTHDPYDPYAPPYSRDVIGVDATNGLGFNPTEPSQSYYARKTFSITDKAKVTYNVTWYSGNTTGRSSNFDYIQFGDKVRLSWNSDYKFYLNTDGNSSTTTVVGPKGSNTTFTKNISITFNTATKTVESFTFDGYDLTSKVSGDLDGNFNFLKFGFERGGSVSKNAMPNYLNSLSVVQEQQNITTADYTVNYKNGDDIVKTVSRTAVCGTTITAERVVYDVNGVKYLASEATLPSMTIVEGTNELNVEVHTPKTATLKITTKYGDDHSEVSNTTFTEADDLSCNWSYTFPAYKYYTDNKWYKTDATTFGEEGTFTDGEVIEKTISYSASAVSQFFEANDMNCSRVINDGVITDNFAYSSGNGVCLYKGANMSTKTTVPAGKYDISIYSVVRSANRTDNIKIYTSTDNTNWVEAGTMTLNADTGLSTKSEFMILMLSSR